MLLLDDGKVLSFGRNNKGQLGINTTTTLSNEPVAVTTTTEYTGSNAVSVLAGYECSFILLNDGKVVSFGRKKYLGFSDDDATKDDAIYTPTLVDLSNHNNPKIVAMGGRRGGAMFITEAGKVLSFATGVTGIGGGVPNGRGIIGDNSDDVANARLSVAVSGDTSDYDNTNAIAIEGNLQFSLMLLNSGKVLSWGEAYQYTDSQTYFYPNGRTEKHYWSLGHLEHFYQISIDQKKLRPVQQLT